MLLPYNFFFCATQKEKFLKFRFSHKAITGYTEDVNYSNIDHFYETSMCFCILFETLKLQSLFGVIAWNIVGQIYSFCVSWERGNDIRASK